MALGFSLTHPAILTICMDLYFRTRKLRLRDNTCIPIPWNRGSPGQMTGEQGWNPPLRAYHVALPPALPPQGFPGGSDSKESACSVGDPGLIPGLGRSPGKGSGNPLQYSCLEYPHAQRNLAGYSPWGCKESDMTHESTHRQALPTNCLSIRRDSGNTFCFGHCCSFAKVKSPLPF